MNRFPFSALGGGRQIASPTYVNDMEGTKWFSTRLRVWIFIDPLGEVFEVKELFTKKFLAGCGEPHENPRFSGQKGAVKKVQFKKVSKIKDL